MRFVIGVLLMIAGFIMMGSIMMNFTGIWWLWKFFDLPIILWMKLAMAAVIVATGEFRTFIGGINALLSKKYVLSAEMQNRAIRLFKLFGKIAICVAVVDMLLGMSLILTYLDDPGALGPMLSVSLISPLYAAFFNLAIVIPITHILHYRRNPEDKLVISEKQVIDKMLELCYRQGITPEEIMNAQEISFKEDK
jgi:magnesium-transporting ATPase (P-type)